MRERIIKWLFPSLGRSEIKFLLKHGILRVDDRTRHIASAIEFDNDAKYLGFELYKTKERPCGEVPDLPQDILDRFDALKDNDSLAGIFAMYHEYITKTRNEPNR